MNTNVGTIDRLARIIIGIGLLSLYFFGPQTVWGLVGIVPLFTAAMKWCPLYSVVGVNTCAK